MATLLMAHALVDLAPSTKSNTIIDHFNNLSCVLSVFLKSANRNFHYVEFVVLALACIGNDLSEEEFQDQKSEKFPPSQLLFSVVHTKMWVQHGLMVFAICFGV